MCETPGDQKLIPVGNKVKVLLEFRSLTLNRQPIASTCTGCVQKMHSVPVAPPQHWDVLQVVCGKKILFFKKCRKHIDYLIYCNQRQSGFVNIVDFSDHWTNTRVLIQLLISRKCDLNRMHPIQCNSCRSAEHEEYERKRARQVQVSESTRSSEFLKVVLVKHASGFDFNFANDGIGGVAVVSLEAAVTSKFNMDTIL